MATEPVKKISLAFGKKPLAKPLVKPSNGIKRRAAALHDSDDEDDSPAGQHQQISAFDQAGGGAVSIDGPSGKKGVLVIPALPNHDRLEYGRRKRQRSDLPQEAEDVVIVRKEVSYGLSIPEQRVHEASETLDGEVPPQIEIAAAPSKSEDQLALEALLGNGAASNRTIPLADEDEAFRRDMSDAVEVPTLDQYLAIPPSEFGAACLRGMGWKDTETLGTANAASGPVLKPRPAERRPALLGVGAKPSAALGIEIGEWGKAAKGGRQGKEPQGYNPVVLKNKKTGEVLTEQELREKVTQQDKTSNEMVFDDTRAQAQAESRNGNGRSRDRSRDEYASKSRHNRPDKSTYSKSDRDERSRKTDQHDDRHSSDRSRYNDRDGGSRSNGHSNYKQDRHRDERRRDREGDRPRTKHDDKDKYYSDRHTLSSSSRSDRHRTERGYESSQPRRD